MTATTTATPTQAVKALAQRFTDEVRNGRDLDTALTDLVAEGDVIVTYSTWTGTHLGEFIGIPATGRQVSVEAWTKDRYRDGRLVQSRIIMDVVGMLT